MATDAATLFPPRRVAWALGLVAAGLFLVSSAQAALRLYHLKRQVAELEHQRRALLEENRRLREEIRRLYEPAYVERLAREQLGLVRPGEIAVVLIPEPTLGPSPSPGRTP